MKRKLNRNSSTYLFTISMQSTEDLQALADFRKSMIEERKRIKNFNSVRLSYGLENGNQPLPRIKVYFRRPSKPYGYTSDRMKNCLYGRGGGVRKEQNPSEADVYLTTY